MVSVENRVASIFNQMKHEYDELSDLWYSWLFSRLHYFIARDITRLWNSAQQNVLDIGCGTGFQSLLYAYAGARVKGVDIAEDLLRVAREKAGDLDPNGPIVLFPVHHPYVAEYNRKIVETLRSKFPVRDFVAPEFEFGDITSLDYDDETFSHVNCCGSVLSLVEDYKRGLAEISRVLKPNGTFIIEVEAKYSMDILWTLFDSISGGWLGYDTNVKEALRQFEFPLSKHIQIEYPFGEEIDPIHMKMRLFTKSGLKRDFEEFNLSTIRVRTIHSVTNFIPSTWLDTTEPSARLTRFFYFLSYLESKIPIPLPGCSLVFTGRKIGK